MFAGVGGGGDGGISQPSFLKIAAAERAPNLFSSAAPFMVLSRLVMSSTGIRHHLQPENIGREGECFRVREVCGVVLFFNLLVRGWRGMRGWGCS